MSSAALLSDLDLLSRLIAFDSTSARPNRPLAEFVGAYLGAAGCRVEQFPDATGEKVNVLASIGTFSGDRSGLVLSGHLDTVPTCAAEWRSDPYTLTRDGYRLIARGTADMKGFVALAMNRLAAAARSGVRKPLALLLTHDEEVGSLGAQRFVREFSRLDALPRSVLVGEPTRMGVVRLHKGHLRLRITVTGKSAHSGLPHLGVNAIDLAADVLIALRTLRDSFAQVRTDASAVFPECPHPALNVGMIRGGSAVNIVADSCVIDIGIRLLPGQSSENGIADVHTALDRLALPVRNATRLDVVNDSPPMLCAADAPLNVELCKLLGQKDTRGEAYASDAGTLARHGFDCVLCGPGNMDTAHQPNEFIDCKDFDTGGRELDRIIAHFCGN